MYLYSCFYCILKGRVYSRFLYFGVNIQLFLAMKRIERLFIFLILLYILVTFFELHKKNISQVVTKPVDDRIEENKDHFDRKFGQIIQRFEQLKLDQIIDSDVLAAASRDISQVC